MEVNNYGPMDNGENEGTIVNAMGLWLPQWYNNGYKGIILASLKCASSFRRNFRFCGNFH
jgi:hypothetical protein